MSDTVRQLICADRLNALKGISIANSYSTDFALVDEWRLTPLEAADLPAIIMRDGDDKTQNFNEVITDRVLTLTVGIFVRGDETPKQLRNMIKDVIKAFGVDRSCGGYCDRLIPVSDSIIMEQRQDAFGDIELIFNAYYSVESWDATKNY